MSIGAIALYIAIALSSLLALHNFVLGLGKVVRILAMRAGCRDWRRRAVAAEARVAELERSFADRANLIESRWAQRQEHLQDQGGRLAGMLTRERQLRVDAETRCRVLERRLADAERAWPDMQRAALNRGLVASHG